MRINKNNVLLYVLLLLSYFISMQAMLVSRKIGTEVQKRAVNPFSRSFSFSATKQSKNTDILKDSWLNRLRAKFSRTFRQAQAEERLRRADEMIASDNAKLKAWELTQPPSYNANVARILHTRPNEPAGLPKSVQSRWSQFKSWIFGKSE
jgi:hypothetical protein